MIAVVNLDESETKAIVRGLEELISAIDASFGSPREMLEDHKRFLIALKEKMSDLLETFK